MNSLDKANSELNSEARVQQKPLRHCISHMQCPMPNSTDDTMYRKTKVHTHLYGMGSSGVMLYVKLGSKMLKISASQ